MFFADISINPTVSPSIALVSSSEEMTDKVPQNLWTCPLPYSNPMTLLDFIRSKPLRLFHKYKAKSDPAIYTHIGSTS